METAGRAVVFSGITVAIGLLALIALPLPFLRSMGYGGMLIPLVSTLVAITLLPGGAGEARPAPGLAAPAHRRQGEPRLDSLGGGRRAAPLAGGRRRAGGDPRARVRGHRPAARQPRTPTRSPSRATPSRAWSRWRTPGSARDRCCPHEILVEGDTDPEQVAADAERRRGHPRRGGARRRGLAPRRDGARRGDPGPRQRIRRGRGHARRASATTAHAAGPDVRVGGQPAANADFIDAVYGSFPLMIALITITTFILLARAFRSLLLPAKAIVLNILSVAAAWGVLVLVWQHGYGSEADLGHRGHRLDPLLDAADGVRLPVRALDGLRGLHPRAHARGVRPHRLHRDRRDPGHRPHRPAGHQRRADPVPRRSPRWPPGPGPT